MYSQNIIYMVYHTRLEKVFLDNTKNTAYLWVKHILILNVKAFNLTHFKIF